jgi:hypothetical protein
MLCERYLTMSFRPSKAQPAGQMLSSSLSAPKGPLQTETKIARRNTAAFSFQSMRTKIDADAFVDEL